MAHNIMGTTYEIMPFTDWDILQIDWLAVANDAGKSVGTVQKQLSRLNIKLEKSVPINTDDSAKDTEDTEDANDED